VPRLQVGTYQPGGNAYLPLFAAICAHLVAAALIFILPSIAIQREPEQIVTINLTDIPAPAAPSAASGPPPKADVKPQPPPEPKKIEAQPVKEKLPPPPPPPEKIEAKPVKEKPEPQVVEPPPPPQVVSLKPRQVVKKVTPEPPKPPKKDDKVVKQQVDKIRQQYTQEAKAKAAEAEARAAQAEADRLTKRLEEEVKQSRATAAWDLLGPPGPAAPSSANSALAQQYYARILGQVQPLWKLPDFKEWAPNMLATVVVTIDKNGKILHVQFEKSSGDEAFDRLVRKTLDDADPLPAIPPALKKERLEIGLNFKPGSIAGR